MRPRGDAIEDAMNRIMHQSFEAMLNEVLEWQEDRVSSLKEGLDGGVPQPVQLLPKSVRVMELSDAPRE